MSSYLRHYDLFICYEYYPFVSKAVKREEQSGEEK